MSQGWSWLLTAVGIVGLVLAGRRFWWAWLIGVGAQGMWAAYAVATRQWGFLASAFAYTVTYSTNALRWWRERVRLDELDVPEFVRLPAVRNPGPADRFVPEWCICRSQFRRTGEHIDDCLAAFEVGVELIRRSTLPHARKVHDIHFTDPPRECRVCAANLVDRGIPVFVRPRPAKEHS